MLTPEERKRLQDRVLQRKLGRELAADMVGLLAAEKFPKGVLEVFLQEIAAALLPPEPAKVQADASRLLALRKFRMPFGLHENQLLDEVPLDYIQWLCDSSRGMHEVLSDYLRLSPPRNDEPSTLDEE